MHKKTLRYINLYPYNQRNSVTKMNSNIYTFILSFNIWNTKKQIYTIKKRLQHRKINRVDTYIHRNKQNKHTYTRNRHEVNPHIDRWKYSENKIENRNKQNVWRERKE